MVQNWVVVLVLVFDSVMVRNVVWKVQYHAGSNMLELKIAKIIAGIARVKLARCTFK